MSDAGEPNHGWNPHVAANQSSSWGHQVFDRPDWHGQAACGRNGVLGDDAARRVRIMFPTRGEAVTVAEYACKVCPVGRECGEALRSSPIAFSIRFGVWNGQSGAVRRQIRKRELREAG